MGKKAQIVIKESVEELKIHLQKQKTLRGEKRVTCLLNLKLEKFTTRQRLSDYLGVHKRTMERWLKNYKSQGIDGMLKDKPKDKRSKIITAEMHKGLSKRVNNPQDSFLGYWDAQQWVRAQYGVEVKYQRIREYLIKHFGTKLKVARKSHVKKDKGAEESFLKTAE